MKHLLKYGAYFRCKSYALLCVGLMLSAFLLAAPYSVQAKTAHIANRLASSRNSVTVIILDMSGSMQENDPAGYRCSATNAFIDLSGVGNYIGVIGLDGNGSTGGPHNFIQAQQWQDPLDMSVLSNRQALKNTIKTKSKNCAPDSTTPTYDALDKALQMLMNSAQSKEIPGSVILLTDGVPDNGAQPSDTVDQINAIDQDLLPQFKAHSWPIDTVALGNDGPITDSGSPYTTFHGFLQAVSNITTGKFYDDSHGTVPGTTALNIAPFFTDIFARHNNREVKDDIDPTALNGALVSRNFAVTPYTDHLDVVTVKDQSDTSVSLKDQNNNVITAQSAGVSVYKDAYYVIYSIDQPTVGTWELDVQGTGQFLMKSLKRSTLILNPLKITGPGTSQSLPIGQPLTITTSLSNQGQIITDATTYTLYGTISHDGVEGTFSRPLDFRGDSSGTYTANTTVPENGSAGTYEITVNVSTQSRANILTAQKQDVRIERFPIPQLFSPQTGQPVDGPIETQAVQWDPFLQFLYNLPLPPFLSQWALQGHPAGQALLQGRVTLFGQPYSKATVKASTVRSGASASSQAIVNNNDNGRFNLQFSATRSGPYILNLSTSGTFADTLGDFGTTQRNVYVNAVSATPFQEGLAWLITLIYIGVLVMLINIFRFVLSPHPFGGWIRSQDGNIAGSFSFKRARRSPYQWYFHPSLVYSRQVSMPPGLLFRFRHGKGIEVRPDGSSSAGWQTGDGGGLRQQFQEVRELRYYPRGRDEDDQDLLEASTYLVRPDITGKNGGDLYDEEYSGSRRGRTRSMDDDEYSNSSRASRRSKGRGKRTKIRNDDDW